MKLVYTVDMIQGSGVLPIYYMSDSTWVWHYDSLCWKRANKSEKGYWGAGEKGKSNRCIPQFVTDADKLPGQVALAVGLLPPDVHGWFTLWFFGDELVGFLCTSKPDTLRTAYADLPKKIRVRFPEKLLNSIATQYQPGVLELRHLAEAKKIGLGIIQSEMKFLQDDMKWMRERLERLTNGVNKLQTAFEHLLVLGEKGT
jgi:hypothetical protein